MKGGELVLGSTAAQSLGLLLLALLLVRFPPDAQSEVKPTRRKSHYVESILDLPTRTTFLERKSLERDCTERLRSE